MSFELTRQQMRLLAKASIDEKRRVIGAMTVADAWDFDAEFENWAHKAQLPPSDEGWRTWLMMAGRGFGKTRAGAEWVEKIARSRPGVRIALVGATIDEARRVADGRVGELVRRGLRGLSFGYRVREASSAEGLRELRTLDLVEVSLVKRPMQSKARVHAVEA